MSGIANKFLGIHINTIMTPKGGRMVDLNTGRFVGKQALIKKVAAKSNVCGMKHQAILTTMMTLIER